MGQPPMSLTRLGIGHDVFEAGTDVQCCKNIIIENLEEGFCPESLLFVNCGRCTRIEMRCFG